MKKTILFICTHNSARSQIAEGLVNHYCKDHCQAFSAGTQPGIVNPNAIKVMKELGIDESLRSPLKVAIIPTFKGIVVQVRIFRLKRAFLPFLAGIFSWRRPFCHFQRF